MAVSRLWMQSPETVARTLARAGHSRAWIANAPGETGGLRASCPELEEVARAIASEPSDFDRHEAIFLEVGPETGTLYGAFLHRTLRGSGQGGLRQRHYPDFESFLRDGLRLAQGMGRKSALAGLWWGGGKGVIATPAEQTPDRREAILAEYGRFVSSLRGCYVTAQDAGTSLEDMGILFRHTRFATCIPEALGGSGNPAAMTAAGVLCALEAALEFLDLGSVEGKVVAMQGAGNVASHTVAGLLERGAARIVVSEVSAERRAALLDHTGDTRLEIRLVEPDDRSIFSEPCDVMMPNALGGVLGPKTIPELRTRLVCGAANNMLADDTRDARALAERGITLVPDFIANRMGIVSCCDEHAGRVHPDPQVEAQLGREHPDSIRKTVLRVLDRARSSGDDPMEAANALADAAMNEPHPIHGDRCPRIVASLLAGGWAQRPAGSAP